MKHTAEFRVEDWNIDSRRKQMVASWWSTGNDRRTIKSPSFNPFDLVETARALQAFAYQIEQEAFRKNGHPPRL